ncbi:MAG: MBL fold metallo-hydrolase [Candidatus Bipolaricaulota bacterium]|nr:MBL fold metallo-hydrolase [Candidatus Bipolaricaulota bacterium]MDW8126853.1 MBL fold metallo-hydrolase [Candidatus Bipolaricaulota bacterium]
MKLCVLGSGSTGNALLLETEDGALLVDCGLLWRDLKVRAERAGFSLRAIRAVYLSHEHADHVRGLDALARRGAKIIASPGTLSALGIKGIPLEPGLEILGMRLFPIPLSHDAREPTGLRLELDGIRIGIVTDLGQVTPLVLEKLRGCEILIFEANHDLEMLLSGPYPWPLKLRILGPLGHLANEEAGQALRSLRDWAKTVFLAHLSQENNTPALALETVARSMDDWQGHLFLTYPDRPSAVVCGG